MKPKPENNLPVPDVNWEFAAPDRIPESLAEDVRDVLRWVNTDAIPPGTALEWLEITAVRIEALERPEQDEPTASPCFLRRLLDFIFGGGK